MREAEAKECGYNYLGKVYGFYCYVHIEESAVDIHGTNWLRRRALDFFIWIENHVYSPGQFHIEIIKKL